MFHRRDPLRSARHVLGARKWIACLNAEAQGGPFYLKTNMHSGHTGSAARYERLQENTEKLAFSIRLFEQMGYDMTRHASSVRTPFSPPTLLIN